MRRGQLRKILGNTFKPVDLTKADQYGHVAGYIVLVQGMIHRHEMNLSDANAWVKRLRAKGVQCEAVRADDPRFYKRLPRKGINHGNVSYQTVSEEETARTPEEAGGDIHQDHLNPGEAERTEEAGSGDKAGI